MGNVSLTHPHSLGDPNLPRFWDPKLLGQSQNPASTQRQSKGDQLRKLQYCGEQPANTTHLSPREDRPALEISFFACTQKLALIRLNTVAVCKWKQDT